MNLQPHQRRSHDLADRPPPVALLSDAARPDVLAHLLRLTDDDRRMRFWRCMPPAAVASHVAAINFDAATRLGIRRDGQLVAMVEGFVVVGDFGQATMEVAFSTDPKWRRRGLARTLGRAIGAIAARRGVTRIVAHCDARNSPMKSLLRAFGAAVVREDDELRADWSPLHRSRAGDFAFKHVVLPTDAKTAQRLFATQPLTAA